jgi:type IV pilus assembly protein PilX
MKQSNPLVATACAPAHASIAPHPNTAHRALHRRAQRGVVLVIALLMLVVISLVASLSIRNATSSEAVSGSVRTTQLAMQAAEIALRYCERSVVDIANSTTTFVTTFAAANIQPYSSTPQWTSTTLWDSTNTAVFVLPATSVNASGVSTTFARMPECIVETLPEANAAGATTSTNTYVITARGFGPEVAAANAARTRPEGSEVWLQSTIVIN